MKNIVGSLSILLFLSLIPLNGQTKDSDDIIRVDTALVSVPVIVSDRNGRYIPNLVKKDFSIYQDGSLQEISFFANAKEPLNVALLLDTSLSTSRVIDKIKRAAIEFIAQLEPRDRASVVTFDSRVAVVAQPTSNRLKLERAIRGVDIGYNVGTVMRDAVLEVAEKTLSQTSGRKAMIILTDGKDFGSYESPASLLNTLEESDVLVYSIFYKTEQMNQRRRTRSGQRRQGRRRNPRQEQRRKRQEQMRKRQKKMNKDAAEYLERMSSLTAGRFFKKEVKDLTKTFRLITSELRNQYRLGYYPTESSEKGEVHNIRVKVDRKKIAVRARSTYRAK